MNQTRHAKLRAAGWQHDPVSDRYSAPGVPLDGTQQMLDQDAAWAAYEAALAKDKQDVAKEDKPS